MCFATMALVAGAVGAGTSAIGTIAQGQATSTAAAYNAQVAANNATVAKQNADYAEKAGAAQAQATSLKGAATGGKIKAGLAAGGVDVNTGSAAAVRSGERELSQLDTENVVANANLQAYGYRTQATNYTAQSGLDTMEAETAPVGADLAAAGGLLGNASSLGFKWSTRGTTPA